MQIQQIIYIESDSRHLKNAAVAGNGSENYLGGITYEQKQF